MASVTIEGSDTPSVYYPRGVRAEVQRTPHIERLIVGGFVNVIDDEGHAEPAPLPEKLKAPSRSASRDDWAEFLAEHTDIVTEGKDRTALLAEYDGYLLTHDAPSVSD